MVSGLDSAPGGRLVLDVQTDLIDIGSRIVAPLVPAASGPKAIGRHESIFTIEGAADVLHVAEMAAVPSALLKGGTGR